MFVKKKSEGNRFIKQNFYHSFIKGMYYSYPIAVICYGGLLARTSAKINRFRIREQGNNIQVQATDFIDQLFRSSIEVKIFSLSILKVNIYNIFRRNDAEQNFRVIIFSQKMITSHAEK
jgi:hypothetical protein